MNWIDRKYILLLSGSLKNFKQKSSNLYNFSCPLCGDSQKNSTKARGYAIGRDNGFQIYCHNCGYKNSFSNFLKHQNLSLHSEYLFEKFQNDKPENSETTLKKFITPPRFDKLSEYTELPLATRCDHLAENHYCIDYLKSRKIPTKYYKLLQFTENYQEFIQKLIPHNEKEILPEPRLIIHFYDSYNDILAITGRALGTSKNKLRYVTIKTKENTDKLIYGLERINKKETMYICEGPLDSLHISNCVAAGNADLVSVAQEMHSKNVVLIWDCEPYNRAVTKEIDKGIGLGYNVVIWPDKWSYKDINEAIIAGETQEFIEKVIKENTFSGLLAKMRFNNWKR